MEALSTRKRKEWVGFFRSSFFLSFPNSPKGNEHIKPNIFLPEMELDSLPSLM